MKGSACVLVLALGAVACGGRAKPAARPAPASTGPVQAAAAASRDSMVPPDAIGQVAITVPDSVLTRQVVAVFGDSALEHLADPTAPEAPTWDIDVRSY